MNRNNALRQVILDCVEHYGGVIDVEQMRRAAKQAGVKRGTKYIDKYAQTLVKEGLLRRISKGRYVHSKSLGDGSLGDFARIPYGDHLYGRILLFMLKRRYANAGMVRQALRSWNPELSREQAYGALNQLKGNGYIETVGTKMYTLTRKTLDAVGLPDVLDAPGEYQAPICERILPHVREYLQVEPPKHIHAIKAHLVSLGFLPEMREVHRAVHRLTKREPVRRVAVATYTLLPDAAAST